MQMNRRNFIVGGVAATAYGLWLAKAPARLPFLNPEPKKLITRITDALLTGTDLTQGVMIYGEGTTPPVIRMRRGKHFHVRFHNGIGEPTTVHWHGLRIPNNMDGVPFLTQPYIYPNDVFDYVFIPPDAGTFWCHPHCNTLKQIGRGLTAVVVVDDPRDPPFDAEIILNIRDWRLNNKGQFIEEFKPRTAARSGTFSTVRSTNWQQKLQYNLLVRTRIALTDVTRIVTLKLEGTKAAVLALDGYPIEDRFILETLTIAPGQRVELAILMPTEGDTASLWDIRGTTPVKIASFCAIGASLRRNLGDLGPLVPNEVPEIDLSSATEVPFILSATAETEEDYSICGSLGYRFWAINKKPWSGDNNSLTDPLVEMKIGKTYVFDVENPTPHAHPLHLHGLVFKPIYSSKRPVKPYFSDTYLVLPNEKVQLAMVADNPGDWMFHCHIIEHQKSGMSTYIRVI